MDEINSIVEDKVIGISTMSLEGVEEVVVIDPVLPKDIVQSQGKLEVGNLIFSGHFFSHIGLCTEAMYNEAMKMMIEEDESLENL